MRPLLAGRGDDVDVAIEEERRSRPRAFEPGDEIGAVGVQRVELAFDACSGQQRADVLDARALGARRIRRVEADELPEQLDRVGNRAHRAARAPSRRSTSPSVL